MPTLAMLEAVDKRCVVALKCSPVVGSGHGGSYQQQQQSGGGYQQQPATTWAGVGY